MRAPTVHSPLLQNVALFDDNDALISPKVAPCDEKAAPPSMNVTRRDQNVRSSREGRPSFDRAAASSTLEATCVHVIGAFSLFDAAPFDENGASSSSNDASFAPKVTPPRDDGASPVRSAASKGEKAASVAPKRACFDFGGAFSPPKAAFLDANGAFTSFDGASRDDDGASRSPKVARFDDKEAP